MAQQKRRNPNETRFFSPKAVDADVFASAPASSDGRLRSKGRRSDGGFSTVTSCPTAKSRSTATRKRDCVPAPALSQLSDRAGGSDLVPSRPLRVDNETRPTKTLKKSTTRDPSAACLCGYDWSKGGL